MLRSAYGKGLGCYMVMSTALIKRSVKFVLLILISMHLLAFIPAGESQVVSLSFKEAPLQKVFAEIRKQTGYSFAYFETDLAKAKPVNINIPNTRVQDALNTIFQNQPLTYTIIEKVVVVKQKNTEKKINQEQSSLQALAPIDLRGRVLNEQDDPVAGVTVAVKGTKIATATDGEGYFALNKVKSNAILILTAVNIQPIEASVNGRRDLILRVKGKTSKLDEVQVIAYGITSRRFNTGNTATVKAEDIERQPVNNPLLTLQGRVPGLVVTQANGVPGGGITIRIQGRNNLNTSFTGSDPLIVIDGVPYPSQNLRTFQGGNLTLNGTILGNSSGIPQSDAGAQGNPLSYINPADIESIDILKDADATAIYGSRAANGAILITTKKGKSGRTKIDINAQHGWGSVAHKMRLLNSQQYMEMRREAKRNDNATISNTDYDLRGLWDTTRYTDWQKELIGGTAQYSRIVGSVSGGTTGISYLISGTYGKETSVFPGDFSNIKGALHFNLNGATLNQKFRIQLSGSYMVDDNSLPAEDFTSRALGLAPVAPKLYNSDGTLNWAPNPQANGNSSWINPLANMYNLFDNKTNNLISNVNLSYRIMPGLELKSSFGYTNLRSDQFITFLNNAFRPEQRIGRTRQAVFSFNSIKTWIIEPQIFYERNIGPGKMSLLVGGTVQQQKNEGRSLYAYGQPSDQLLKDMGSATTLQGGTPDIAMYRYNAIFSRLNYNLQNKYLVNLTARRDGSSRFGPENLFHNFGAVGLGWIFSQEDFLKGLHPFLSFGKLRGSYGTTGNDQIRDYQFMSLFSSVTSTVPYQAVAGLSPSVLSNPYLEWEKTEKIQIGVDLGFLSDRVLLTTNYFRNRSSNSLTNIWLPITTGFPLFTDNLAALIQNTGWEFQLNTDNIKTSKISWSSSINLTIQKNKLIAFPGLETSTMANEVIIGQPLGITKDATFFGVNPLTGLYSGSSTQNVVLSTTPKFFGGLQNNINYKGLQLSFLFQFTKQSARHAVVSTYSPGRFSGLDAIGNQPVEVMDRWQKTGDVALYQRFTTNINLSPVAANRDFKDASFMRLKNISLSYYLPDRFCKKAMLQYLRVFANAQNLFTITRYKGLDPESLSITSLPPLRVVTLGLQVTL